MTRVYEEILPVSTYGWDQSEEDCIRAARETAEAEGWNPDHITRVEFQEFDSPNPYHACGYWLVTICTGSPSL